MKSETSNNDLTHWAWHYLWAFTNLETIMVKSENKTKPNP